MKQKPLTKRQQEEIKIKIQKERDGLIFNNVFVSEEFNVKAEDLSDEVDQANAAEASAQRLRFRNRETFYSKKLTQALEKIEKNTYGECEECGDPIGYRRLFARPTAELCIACKEDSERDESLSLAGQQSKSLGQQFDLAAQGF